MWYIISLSCQQQCQQRTSSWVSWAFQAQEFCTLRRNERAGRNMLNTHFQRQKLADLGFSVTFWSVHLLSQKLHQRACFSLLSMSYFLSSDSLTSWGLVESGGTARAKVSQFLERVNSPESTPFTGKPARPPSLGSHTQSHCPPTPITRGQGPNKQG